MSHGSVIFLLYSKVNISLLSWQFYLSLDYKMAFFPYPSTGVVSLEMVGGLGFLLHSFAFLCEAISFSKFRGFDNSMCHKVTLACFLQYCFLIALSLKTILAWTQKYCCANTNLILYGYLTNFKTILFNFSDKDYKDSLKKYKHKSSYNH